MIRPLACIAVVSVATGCCCRPPQVGHVVRISDVSATPSEEGEVLPEVEYTPVYDSEEFSVYSSGPTFFVVPKVLTFRVDNARRASGFAIVGGSGRVFAVVARLEPELTMMHSAQQQVPPDARLAWYPMPESSVTALGTTASSVYSTDAVWVAGANGQPGYVSVIIQAAGKGNIQPMQQLLLGEPGIQLIVHFPIRLKDEDGTVTTRGLAALCSVGSISVSGQSL